MREVQRLFKRAQKLLTKHGRISLRIFVFVQVLLAVLDTVALYLISTIFIGGGEKNSIMVQGGGITISMIIFLFAARSLLSTVITWRTMQVLASEEVAIGHGNLTSFVRGPTSSLSDFDLNDLFNAVDRGPGALITGVLFNTYSMIAETITGIMILTTLMFLQPITAATTTIFFIGVALFQHRLLSHRSTKAGEDVVAGTRVVYETLADAFNLRKVLSVMPSNSLLPFMQQSRQELSQARIRSSFFAILPRYFMELVLALGLALVALVTYLTGGQSEAIASITVFAAAGFRLLPIVNRLQSLMLQMLTLLPSARLAQQIELLDQSVSSTKQPENDVLVDFVSVSFSYPQSKNQALKDINLSLKPGLQYAIIGPSGAGKTTLIDLAIGVLKPTSGSILRNSTCSIGYVPQDTHIAKLNLEQNIALEWDREDLPQNLISTSINRAELAGVQSSHFSVLSLGTSALSGGQAQRVGLARAFFRNPDILFLDEATSALDSETESMVMQSVHALRNKSTVVIIAHRLSTVQHADEVIYLEEGKVLGIGTFEELRKTLPQLQRQIELGTLDLLD